MTASQRALAAFFTFTGVMHFVIPRQYEATVPDYVPISAHDAVVYSGYAEIAGALAVIPPATRGLARWWLIALLSRSSRPTSTWPSTPSRSRASTCSGCRAGRCGPGCRSSR